jgi:hypothetical protein
MPVIVTSPEPTMHSCRSRRRRRVLPALVTAAFPWPALAADRVMSAWGPYLFLAIAVTLVVVVLLYEALDDDGAGQPRRARDHEGYGNSPGD